MKKQLLLVDGYNMIGAWPELVRLKGQDKLEDAREELLKQLSEYSKYEGIPLIVVFDAQFVPGIQKSYQQYQLEVIFTQEGETADSCIERMTGERNDRFTQVTVATSDLAEQWTVFSQGALRISANKLYKSVKKTREKVKTHAEDLHFQHFRRNSPWTGTQLGALEKLRNQLTKKHE